MRSVIVNQSKPAFAIFDSSMSRHVDTDSQGPVDLVVAESRRDPMVGCWLHGVASRDASLRWSVPVGGANCSSDLSTIGRKNVALSDDGSTAVLSAKVNGSVPVLFAFNAQAGQNITIRIPKSEILKINI